MPAHVQLASSILLAAQAYDQAYDIEASSKATSTAEVNKQIVDYEQYQKLTIREAVAQVVVPELQEPVYLLLKFSWNDVLVWSTETIKDSANDVVVNDISSLRTRVIGKIKNAIYGS
jgi:hypothetical protein